MNADEKKKLGDIFTSNTNNKENALNEPIKSVSNNPASFNQFENNLEIYKVNDRANGQMRVRHSSNFETIKELETHI